MSNVSNIFEYYFFDFDKDKENFHKSIIALSQSDNNQQYAMNISFRNNFNFAQNLLNRFLFDLNEPNSNDRCNYNSNDTSRSNSSCSGQLPKLNISVEGHDENNEKNRILNDLDTDLLALDSLSEKYDSLSTKKSYDSNFTNASAEFVWINTKEGLTDFNMLPWTDKCIQSVIDKFKTQQFENKNLVESINRFSYYLQKILLQLSIEIKRFSSLLNICTKQDIVCALEIVLSPTLTELCKKSCLQATTMFAVSKDSLPLTSKSRKAGLVFNIGSFHKWMIDVQLSGFILEISAIYLCAAMETLLKEMLTRFFDVNTTTLDIDENLSRDYDFNFLSPLNSCETLAVSKSLSSLNYSSEIDSGHCSIRQSKQTLKKASDSSKYDFENLIDSFKPNIILNSQASDCLYYFLRKSDRNFDIYEHSAIVAKWLRIAKSFSQHRLATCINENDIMETSRVLISIIDVPVHNYYTSLSFESNYLISRSISANCYLQNLYTDIGFKLIFSQDKNLMKLALHFLPFATRFNTYNEYGLSPLMMAVTRNDIVTLKALIGSSVNQKTLAKKVHIEMQNWTALTFASAMRNYECARLLLNNGANVEGGFEMNDDRTCTLTPLQIAAAHNNTEMVQLLLDRGAQPFVSTQTSDNLRCLDRMNRGCFSAVCVAAAHGNLNLFQQLISQRNYLPEIYSLEDILYDRNSCRKSIYQNTNSLEFNKTQIRALQDALYQSIENKFLNIIMEIRSLQIPWSLYSWTKTLQLAFQSNLDETIELLLKDFSFIFPVDFNSLFVYEVIPILFEILKITKKTETIYLISDILSQSYGNEKIKTNWHRNSCDFSKHGSEVYVKFLNNPYLSDVLFRIENQLFYAHKIVLITSSDRLKSILLDYNSEDCSSPQLIEINDIRYETFQMIMLYLYQGSLCTSSMPENLEDWLEILAAANFFKIENLINLCEMHISKMLTIDNFITIFVHSKVYNAVKLLDYCFGYVLQNMTNMFKQVDYLVRLINDTKNVIGCDFIESLRKHLQQHHLDKRNLKRGFL